VRSPKRLLVGWCALASCASLLAACGGGGSASGSDASVPPDARSDDPSSPDGTASDGTTTDSFDASFPDAEADAIDASGEGASASDAGSDASDAGSDASDSAIGIACAPMPELGKIYYSRGPVPLPDGGAATDGEIWVVTGDGASDTKLGPGELPRLSPDGTHLLFRRDFSNYYKANVYVRDLPQDGGAALDNLVVATNGADWIVNYAW